MQFSEWTRLDIPGPGRKVTVRTVVDHLVCSLSSFLIFKAKFGVVVETISVKNALVWLGEESKLDTT